LKRIVRAYRAPRAAIRLVACALVAAPATAEPSIHFVEHEEVALEIRPLTAETVPAMEGPATLDVGPSSPARLELRVLWPDAQEPSLLRLRAERELTPAGHLVRLHSELVRPGEGAPVQATREIAFRSGSGSTTALFEVARLGERVLTLAVAGELTRRMTYSATPVVGEPLLFELEIEWVEQGRAVTLETNQLSTFVGQSVGYSFRLGATGEAESLSVRLLPVQLVGDTVRLDVDVSGTLPDPEGGVVLVSRQEQWLSTRDTTTALSLASGEPPTGFRFQVTPRF
jgi:hypothetical protein